MDMETVSESKCFGGIQRTVRHDSDATGTPMNVAIYLPPAAGNGPVPVLYYLSGLTCTEENVTAKAGAQRIAAREGLAFVAPDTSPRGLDLPGEHDDWDFGTRLRSPDFAMLARGYGMAAFTVRRTADFADALRGAMAADGPALIHLLLDLRDVSPYAGNAR